MNFHRRKFITSAKNFSTETPGAIVIDVMLPDGNGLDLLEELRGQNNKTPIIMLNTWNRSKNKYYAAV